MSILIKKRSNIVKEVSADVCKYAAVQQEVLGILNTIMDKAQGCNGIREVVMEFVGMKWTKTNSQLG